MYIHRMKNVGPILDLLWKSEVEVTPLVSDLMNINLKELEERYGSVRDSEVS
jgi:hypothetical protein